MDYGYLSSKLSRPPLREAHYSSKQSSCCYQKKDKSSLRTGRTVDHAVVQRAPAKRKTPILTDTVCEGATDPSVLRSKRIKLEKETLHQSRSPAVCSKSSGKDKYPGSCPMSSPIGDRKYSHSDRQSQDVIKSYFERFAEEVQTLERTFGIASPATELSGSDYYHQYLNFREQIQGRVHAELDESEKFKTPSEVSSFIQRRYIPLIKEHIEDAMTQHGLSIGDLIEVQHFNSAEQIVYRAALFSLMLEDSERLIPEQLKHKMYESAIDSLYKRAKPVLDKAEQNVKATTGFVKASLINHTFQAFMMAATCKYSNIDNILQNGTAGMGVAQDGQAFGQGAYQFVARYNGDGRLSLLSNPSRSDFVNWLVKTCGDVASGLKAPWKDKVMLVTSITKYFLNMSPHLASSQEKK
ncbi:hypothetical protein [Kistimonas asteriae]|uniref:hypothetical protein n=1 Tax=Kistimonas asteriae TaxID=517724 RepID=UPI001BA45359|nr:hypothetical protein [Kistimonas asteriae]